MDPGLIRVRSFRVKPDISVSVLVSASFEILFLFVRSSRASLIALALFLTLAPSATAFAQITPQAVESTRKKSIPANETAALTESRAHYEKAQKFSAEGKNTDAVFELRLALEKEPGNTVYACALAMRLIDTGNTAEALAILDRTAAGAPGDPGVSAALAIYNQRTGDAASAIGYYRTALELAPPGFPDTASIRNNLGQLLLASGDDNGAESQFISAAQADFQYGPAWLNLGLVYTEKADFASAAVSFEHAVAIMPDNHSARNNLAYAYYKLGRNDESVREMDRALKADPANESYKKSLAFLRAEKKKADAERAERRKNAPPQSIAAEPEHAENTIAQQGEPPASAPDTPAAPYSAGAPATRVAPPPAAAAHASKPATPAQIESAKSYAEAKIAFLKNDFPAAAKLLRRAVALAPDNIEYKVFAAMLLDAGGKHEDAAQMINQELEKTPQAERHPALLNTQGAFYAAEGERGKAAEVFEEALRQYPRNGCAAAGLGTLKAIGGDCLSALPLLESASVNGCRSASTLNNLSFCLARSDDIEKAGALLEEAAALEPENPTVAANMELLSIVSRDDDAGKNIRARARTSAAPGYAPPLEAMTGIPAIVFSSRSSSHLMPIRAVVTAAAKAGRNAPDEIDSQFAGELARALSSTNIFTAQTRSDPAAASKDSHSELTISISVSAAGKKSSSGARADEAAHSEAAVAVQTTVFSPALGRTVFSYTASCAPAALSDTGMRRTAQQLQSLNTAALAGCAKNISQTLSNRFSLWFAE